MRQEIDAAGRGLGAEILEDDINAAVFPSNWENSDISIPGVEAQLAFETLFDLRLKGSSVEWRFLDARPICFCPHFSGFEPLESRCGPFISAPFARLRCATVS